MLANLIKNGAQSGKKDGYIGTLKIEKTWLRFFLHGINMAKYDFTVYDPDHDIIWNLSMDFWQLYKTEFPDEIPFTTEFWRYFDTWVQMKYNVISKPYQESVFAFENHR